MVVSSAASPGPPATAAAAVDFQPDSLPADYYRRQVLLPQLGVDGQEAIRNTRLLVIGAGGLGSSAIPYAAGVGFEHIILVDQDFVEKSNLHRQVLHSVDSLGEPKVFSARRRCMGVNPSCVVEAFPESLSPALGAKLFPRVDIVFDCTDNLPSRLLISDLAAMYRKTVVSGSALRCQGQMLTYSCSEPREPLVPAGCYRCLLGEAAKPPIKHEASEIDGDMERLIEKMFAPLPTGSQDCTSEGVLGPVPGVIGLQMVLQAVRLSTSKVPRLRDSLSSLPNYLLYDYTNPFRPMMATTLRQKNATECVCAAPSLRPADYEQVCEATLHPDNIPELTVGDLHLSQDGHVSVPCWETGPRRRAYCLIDARPRHHSTIGTLPGAIIWPLDELAFELKSAVRNSEQSFAEMPAKLRDALRVLASLVTCDEDCCRAETTVAAPLGSLSSSPTADSRVIGRDEATPSDAVPSSPTAKPALAVLVFCRSGNASRSAARLLRTFFAIRRLQEQQLAFHKTISNPITAEEEENSALPASAGCGGLEKGSVGGSSLTFQQEEPAAPDQEVAVFSLKGGIAAIAQLLHSNTSSHLLEVLPLPAWLGTLP